MSEALVAIKGTPDGLLVTIEEGDWHAVWEELRERLDRAASFFQGARVMLQVGARPMDAETVQRTVELFTRHDIAVQSVLSDSAATRDAVRRAGLQTGVPSRQSRVVVSSTPLAQKTGLILRQSLRSGQTMTAERGSVLIIGDVHAGAEVVAAGDVVVWGRLRGLVHAGAQGNDEAVICALCLAPPQLRIGNYIARAPEEEGSSTPEIALVRDGQIVVESWGVARV